jgi:hypothetical protein
MSDSRNVFRYKTYRPAKILLADGSVIDATVRDLSTKGARLEVANPKQVPADFFLMVQGSSERFGCHVVWQNGTNFGVQYLYN